MHRSLTFIFRTSFALLALSARPICANIVWPGATGASWTQLDLSDGRGDGARGAVDMVGDASDGFAFALDSSQGVAFFSMQVAEAPKLQTEKKPTKKVWQVLLDGDGDQLIDWVLQLDQNKDKRVELVPLSSQGDPPGTIAGRDGIKLSKSEAWTGDVADYARVRPTGDAAYVDLAVPLVDLQSNVGDSFAISFSTSGKHDKVNKDVIASERDALTNYTPSFWSGSAVSLSGGGAVANPEPSTFAALSGLSALGLAVWMWRKRRQGELSASLEDSPEPNVDGALGDVCVT